ncbi:hypothetical protein WN943_016334 [Citrus x changshan-huyou]
MAKLTLMPKRTSSVEKLQPYVDKLPKANKDFIVIMVDAPSKNCLHFTVLSEANEDQIPEVAIKPDDLVVRKLSFLPRFLQENCQVTN